jgi:hypothetical protein
MEHFLEKALSKAEWEAWSLRGAAMGRGNRMHEDPRWAAYQDQSGAGTVGEGCGAWRTMRQEKGRTRGWTYWLLFC